MSILRVEKLFRALSPKERDAFKATLQTARPVLQKLYEALEELESSQIGLARAKRKLCERLYNEPYSKAQDARFRDDCRKLGERIKHFLAEQQCADTLAKNPLFEARFLLEALLERGLWTEFEADCRKARADALAACDYENLMAIEVLRLRQLWESKTHKPDALRSLMAAVRESKMRLQEHHATLYAYLGMFFTAAAHYLERYEKAEQWEPLQQVDFSNVQPPLAQYYALKAQAFQQVHHAHLELMKKALDTIMRLPSLSPHILAEQQTALANMGLAYMLNGDYKHAHYYYQKAFEFSETHQLDFGAQMAFNYASVLMKLGDYKNAARLFQAKWSSFAKSDMVRHRAEAMRCFCHIFLGELEQAEMLLPKSLAAYPETVQSYFRYAAVAIDFEKNKLLQAERATENLLRRLRRRPSSAFWRSEKELVNLYRKFIHLSQQVSHKSKSTQLSALKSELQHFLNQRPEYRDALPVVWLEQKLKQSRAD
ncbi:MAG: hypothetical protein NZM05_09575 [Chloroherpetonaceae bacterium]|nr:hypothetical protein [Chloroherpetonaceae bacterium]